MSLAAIALRSFVWRRCWLLGRTPDLRIAFHGRLAPRGSAAGRRLGSGLSVERRVKRALLEHLSAVAAAAHPGCRIETSVVAQYRNMREVLDRHPDVVERARQAMRAAGIEPVEKPIRGGTDGSRLSFMGLPTPNLFAGEHNFHSRLEWVSAQDMDKAAEVIVELCRVWGEDS